MKISYLKLSQFLLIMSSLIGSCLIGSCLISSCSLPEDTRKLMEGDIYPPQFIMGSSVSEDSIQLSFSEPVTTDKDHLRLRGHSISNVTSKENLVTISYSPPLTPGVRVELEGEYWDESRNSLFLITPIYGFNNDPAKLVINEFSSKGSDNNPDRIELFVLEKGNIAGRTLYDGTKTSFRQVKVLPDYDADAGDYIIVHFEKTDTPCEDEDADLAACTAPGSHPEALDLWVENPVGISGNNGVISLYVSPNGDMIDGLFYSNRTVDSDDRYGGFGSSTMQERVEELCRSGNWIYGGNTVVPEDGISSENSTATRSMCRISPEIDTDTREDWIIVDTSESSFGYENSHKIYEPED